MSRVEVIGGGFRPDPRSRFDGVVLVLRPDSGTSGWVRHKPAHITRFRVRDGAWARFFDDAGDWTRAMTAASLAGTPAVAANALLPTFFFGQKEIVTWANALIGAAAATAAIKSTRQVRFEARFASGAALQARVEERALMGRLPRIYQAMHVGS